MKNKKRNYTQQQKQTIIEQTGLKNGKPIVLIFGGSQGAQSINQAVLGIIKNKENKAYQIIWAAGPKQYDGIQEKLEESNMSMNYIENTKIVPYIYNMEEMMNVADLIVARSGAMTITEIANLGKPSILIPLPNVSHNHQLYNAQVLEKKDAAKIILDEDESSVKEKALSAISSNLNNKTIIKEIYVKNKIYNVVIK